MATPAPATTPQRVFESACQRLQEKGLIEGALLVSRDGFPLAGSVPGAEALEVFAAMHATALGAAEVALSGLGPSHGVTLAAENQGRKFISRGVTRDLFVVACVKANADCHHVLAWMDELSAALK